MDTLDTQTQINQLIELTRMHIDAAIAVADHLEAVAGRIEQLTEMVQRVGESMILAIQGTGDRLGHDFFHAINRTRRE